MPHRYRADVPIPPGHMLLYRYLSGDLLHPRESQLTWARPRRRPGSIGTVPGELSSKNGPHEKQHKNIDIRNNKTVCIGKCAFVSLTSKRNCFTKVTGNQFQKRTPCYFRNREPAINKLALTFGCREHAGALVLALPRGRAARAPLHFASLIVFARAGVPGSGEISAECFLEFESAPQKPPCLFPNSRVH